MNHRGYGMHARSGSDVVYHGRNPAVAVDIVVIGAGIDHGVRYANKGVIDRH